MKKKNQHTVYVGKVADGRPFVTVDGIPLYPGPSQRLRNHSPYGFNWGYRGSGPAQLALAILLDYYGDECQAQDLYQRFKESAVAGWAEAGWSITGLEIDLVAAEIRGGR